MYTVYPDLPLPTPWYNDKNVVYAVAVELRTIFPFKLEVVIKPPIPPPQLNVPLTTIFASNLSRHLSMKAAPPDIFSIRLNISNDKSTPELVVNVAFSSIVSVVPGKNK